ncbi:MAG: hypothetical protein AB1589_38120 [Cyanobacteriota bacterium]
MSNGIKSYLTRLEQELLPSLGYSLVLIDPQISVHRLVFAPASNAPSLVEFQFSTTEAEVLQVIPPGVANTATVSAWQGIEVLSAQLCEEMTNAINIMKPFDLPDLDLNGRDGIAARYRFITHNRPKGKGFDVFNPDGSCGYAQRNWLALTLKIVREVFDDPQLTRYLAELHRCFML